MKEQRTPEALKKANLRLAIILGVIAALAVLWPVFSLPGMFGGAGFSG